MQLLPRLQSELQGPEMTIVFEKIKGPGEMKASWFNNDILVYVTVNLWNLSGNFRKFSKKIARHKTPNFETIKRGR